MTAKQIDETIDALSRSQGLYGRLRRDLDEATDENRADFYAQYEKCGGPVDFVIAFEGG